MRIEKIAAIICVIIMFAIGFGTLLSDNKEPVLSEDENRMLAGMPDLTFENIISGDFSSDYEDYMIDRIPFRDYIINVQDSISQSMSIVTLEDAMNIIETESSQQMEGLDNEELIETTTEIETATPKPQSTPTILDSSSDASEDITPTNEPTATPDPDKFNDSKYKSIGYIESSIDKTTILLRFETNDVIDYTDTLNQLSSMLPDDGNLVYMFCLESIKTRSALSCITDDKDITMVDETTEVLEYYTNDSVHIISTLVLFEEPLENNEQMYFFTDHHWTVEGAHYAYTEAMNQIGITPVEWEDYDVTYEYPFRGAYYKKAQTNYYEENPDTLAIISFPQADTFTHYLGDDNIEELPIIYSDAAANDRYRVYYDGPTAVGPLSIIETTSNTDRNALIILDSYGLSFSTMLIPHYDTICLMDLRYMYKSTERYYIDDIMEKYNVDDIFIVLGDSNTFGTYYSKTINLYMTNPN